MLYEKIGHFFLKSRINHLEKNKFLVNYVSFLTTDLESLKLNTSQRKILLSSVKLGQTRLIDNIEFN